MNAVVDQRHAERYEIQGINYELNVWGRWIEKHMDFEGYPGVCALEAWRSGRGGGSPGHKVLCLDMPDAVYAVHGRVLLLPEQYREALWIWYVIRVKPDGTLWPVDHKCKKAGISEDALRQRVNRARRRMAGLD